jgi:hypothetical protein
MLDFDRARSAFVYDGATVGPSTAPADLARTVDGTLAAIPGQPGWETFKTEHRPLNLSLSFHDGRAHSGFFWATMPGGGSWDEAERIEAERRVRHQAIMRELFGTERYADERIDVALVRDPRSYLEEIFFTFASAPPEARVTNPPPPPSTRR